MSQPYPKHGLKFTMQILDLFARYSVGNVTHGEVESKIFYYLRQFFDENPTCGQEQRRFLDEIEINGKVTTMFQDNQFTSPYSGIWIDVKHDHKTKIAQRDFAADLSKVIKGE